MSVLAGSAKRETTLRQVICLIAAAALAMVVAASQGAPRQRGATSAQPPTTQPGEALSGRGDDTPGTPLPTRTVRIVVLDNSSGQPIGNANVDCQNIPKDVELKTDPHGQVDVELRGGIDPIISAWCTGYINQRVRWRIESGGPPPAEYTLRLDPVSSIGGKVVDDAGKPIAGANVEIYVNGTMENVGSLFVEGPWTNRAVVTAADGTWHFDRIPLHADSIRVAAWDYQHLDGGYFFLKPYTPVAALRDKTAIITLARGVPVTGTVVNPFSGNPVPHATISFGADPSASNKIPPITTKDDGTFSVAVRPGSRLYLTAGASLFRPEVHEQVMGDKPLSLEFDLSPLHFQGEGN